MRYKELDSLRGLVALSVVIDHFLMTFIPFASGSYEKKFILVNLIKYSPLHIFWAGHEAVIFFFVLSGFVLSLPFLSKTTPYTSFLAKRICRVYPPFIISLVFALVLYVITPKVEISSLSAWFNSSWQNNTINTSSFLNQLTLIGYFKSNILNGVIWSLIHEMRISIIFPFLIYLCMRSSWKLNLVLGICFSYFAFRFTGKFPPSHFSESIQLTVHFIGFFILGIILATYKNYLVDFLRKLPIIIKLLTLLCAVILYTVSWSFPALANNMWLTDWFIGFGSAIFTVFVLTYPKFLLHQPFNFLGKTSYSLYLLHFPIIKFMFTLLYGFIPVWAIVMTTIPIIFLAAYLSNLFIEIPSQNFGKTLVTRIGVKRVSESH